MTALPRFERMADGTLAAWVHPTPDTDVATRTADALRAAGAVFGKRVQGLDELYWDFEFDGKMFTLHTQHYLGIGLMACEQNAEAEDLLRHVSQMVLPAKLAFSAWWERLQKTGEIAPVQLGCRRSDLRKLWGEPDDESASRAGGAPHILVYGQVEFHFEPEPEGGLFLIYRDNDDGVVELCIKREPGELP